MHRIPVPAAGGSGPMLLILREDVTGQLHDAHGLAVDAQLVQALLDYMPGFVSLKDVHTRKFLFATGTEKVVPGARNGDLTGKTATEVYEPDLAQRIETAENELLATPERVVDHRFSMHRWGDPRWFYSRKLVVPDQAQRPRYLMTFNLDITRQVETEEALDRANRFLDALLDTMPSFLSVREIQSGALVRVNPSFCDFKGQAAAELLGRSAAELEPGELRLRQRDERALLAGRHASIDRTEAVQVGSGMRWLRRVEVPIRNEAGKITHVLALREDVTARVTAEQKLAQSRSFLDRILRSLPWPITVTDARDGTRLLANREAGELPDVQPELAQALAKLDREVRQAPRRPADEELPEAVVGGQRWHRIRKVAIGEAADPCRYIVTIDEDVSERHRHVEELRRSEGNLRRSQSIARIGSWRWCLETQRLECSDEMLRLLGHRRRDQPPTLREALAAILPEDRQSLRAVRRIVEAGRGRRSLLLRIQRRDGIPRYLHVDIEPEAEGERTKALIGTAQDVSERIESERKVRHLALHDALTGLPNRLQLDEHLARAVIAARRKAGGLALHCLDLSDFRGINDVLGHGTGDELLRQVSGRLLNVVRGGDLVARIGGDEFAVLQLDVSREEPAATLASRLIGALSEPFKVADQELHVSASVGIALMQAPDARPADLLRQSDIALNAALNEGRGNFRFFTPELNAALQERRRIEQRLRMALEEGKLDVAFQPQFELAGGRMVGVEALVRWHDSALGQVSPERFVSVAEDTAQILQLGGFVLRRACEVARAFQLAGLPIGRLAVNLSAAQFAYQDLVETIVKVLEETGLPPASLELEITETTLMHDRYRATTTLEALHALGVGIALDDFGTGYSSLSYLKRFPLDKIKIDRSFITDLPQDQDDVAITRTIINLGRSLGLKVIAEGVETAEQRDFLLKEGCDEGQGYLFARPLTATALEQLLLTMLPVAAE